MENAGRAVASEATRVLKNKKDKVAVLCGKGNNGGDGFCAARHLRACGRHPDVYLAGRVSDVSGEAKVNLNILIKLKQKITHLDYTNLGLAAKRLSRYRLIVDALLGVGLRGEVLGIYRDLINAVNASGSYVLSVDIPSGLDATTGKILGACVKADKTVTFVAKKRGMVTGAGPRVCGEVVIAGLGVPLL